MRKLRKSAGVREHVVLLNILNRFPDHELIKIMRNCHWAKATLAERHSLSDHVHYMQHQRIMIVAVTTDLERVPALWPWRRLNALHRD